MRCLYSALLYALFPLVLLRMLWRSRRAPAYRQHWSQRFGIFATDFDTDQATLWVHAVSVGEVLACAPLIEQMLRDYPEYRLVVTTTTPTGSGQVQALFGNRVFHVYLPWDLPGSVQRFLGHTRPRLLLLMETELWPNLLHYSHKQGCSIILANARLSERSAKGYRRFARLTKPMLACLDQVACQSTDHAERFLSLGLAPEVLTVTGSIKFDLQIDDSSRARALELRSSLGADLRSVLLAASTHEGEEEHILSAFQMLKQAIPDCLLVLVPRHPERFDRVYTLCMEEGWRVVRRSEGALPDPADDVLLGDTMGELALFFGAASVAFIGGSLVEHGGHNPLEAAVWGVPVVSGSHLFNFTEVCSLLAAAGAMRVLERPEQLGSCLQELFSDAGKRQKMGAAGRQLVADQRGAGKILMNLVAQQLESS